MHASVRVPAPALMRVPELERAEVTVMLLPSVTPPLLFHVPAETTAPYDQLPFQILAFVVVMALQPQY